MKFEIGEIVQVKDSPRRKKAVLLGFENGKLFGTGELVKIMVIGQEKPTYTLFDRIVKL